ncbi:hypothetical protein [Yoonia sp. 2307UL14-13]|uniref:hypothetical protein n=1 Tax=Yoonia sp. 2307UL14-13 TaxID=3126506 RepID=UPI0030A1A15B
MTSDTDEFALANDADAQLELIKRSYASGDAMQIDRAIAEVTWARRMKKQGIDDFLEEADTAERAG